MTLATSYAFGDIFGIRHSLHRGVREAKLFYGSYAAMVALAAAIVLIPNAPLGLITTAVQALAGILLPSATVFLVLLCNDREVLGPWTNKPWLNVCATFIVGVLLMLSMILVITTVLPFVDVNSLVVVLAVILVVGMVPVVILGVRAQLRGRSEPVVSQVERENWRMPGLALLQRPPWSPVRRVAMITLSVYLVISIVVLAIKAVELATGH